jgi:hypothetical protein
MAATAESGMIDSCGGMEDSHRLVSHFFSFLTLFEIEPYRQVSEENCAQFSPTAEIATGDGAIVAWMCGVEHAMKTSISANDQTPSVVSFWPPCKPYAVKPPCLA